MNNFSDYHMDMVLKHYQVCANIPRLIGLSASRDRHSLSLAPRDSQDQLPRLPASSPPHPLFFPVSIAIRRLATTAIATLSALADVGRL